MARLLRNRRSQPPLTSDEAAPGENGTNGTEPNSRAARPGNGWSRWPRTEPGFASTKPVTDQPSASGSMRVSGPVPAAEQAETERADADDADAPFWVNWERVDEPGNLDDYGDGMPADGPADDAVTDVDPNPVPAPRPEATPVGDPHRPSANGGKARAGSAGAGTAGTGTSGAGARAAGTGSTAGGISADGTARPAGLGEQLGSLAHLSQNPRMRTWQRRVIIAVVVGVVTGFLLHNWRWGLTLAVLAGIADTIYRSRTSFRGPAGVRLTKAQKRTARQLASLERKGYRTMHVLAIPDSVEQIDHLVIGPAGVFAIDSEDWDRRMPVRTSSHRHLWHGPRDMNDRLMHAQWEAGQAATLLSAELGHTVMVRPAMAVYGPKIPWDVAEIRDVDTFSGPRLRKYLRRRAKKRDMRLSATEVERIDQAAHVAFGREAAGPR